MIVVTGAAGFIGSCMIGKLNREGFFDIVAVDDFSNTEKNKNLRGKNITHRVHRDDFFQWLSKNHRFTEFIFHIGARTDTTEHNKDLLDELNLEYSRKVWKCCIRYGLPLIYASSAATYGKGEIGYRDDHELVNRLKPMNLYGVSKNDFDKWVLQQRETPYFWIGLKYFNVYGPNEYHKGKMASVVYHAYKQVKETGRIRLFRSHNPEYADGEQKRDFIYIMDVLDVMYYLMHHRQKSNSGIYNLGTGNAETFLSLAGAVFVTLGLKENIQFIDTPEELREKYQYFTEAPMEKLRAAGYKQGFTPLEKGIREYILMYLEPGKYY